VKLRDAGGHVRSLATLPPDESVVGLAWSGDGRYVGWARSGPASLAVSVHEPATGSSATWNAPGGRPFGDSLGARQHDFVVVDDTGTMALLDPAALFDEGEPVLVDLAVEEPSLLAVTPDRILATSNAGTSRYGGPQDVYDVRADGSATLLFGDGDDLEEGVIRNVAIGTAALTADGRRLVYSTGTAAGACDFHPELVVRDLVAGRERAVPAPQIPGFGTGIPVSVTTAPDGLTYAAVTSDAGDCRDRERSLLFVLDGDRWAMRDEDAHWAASAEDGRYAVIRQSGALEVDAVRVDGGVTYAAWSPN
jgi:hypothetical protein